MATPTSPFTVFNQLASNSKPTDTLPTDRLVVGIVAGNFQTKNGLPSVRGLTGCGLYSILRIAQDSNLNSVVLRSVTSQNATSPIWQDNAFYIINSQTFIYRTAEAFIGHLNAIHNNINNICRCYLSSSSVTDGYQLSEANETALFEQTSFPEGVRGKNSFLNITQYILPNSYTGNTAGDLPIIDNGGAYKEAVSDLTGNGITGAFVTYDSPDGISRLSRTGIEFYTILELLKYDCYVAVAGNYVHLTTNLPSTLSKPAETNVIVTLDMGSYIDGQGISTGNNRAVYGGLIEGYSVGNTYNYCHGSSAFALNDSLFGSVVTRNNVINGIIDGNLSENDELLVIHAGLSGADATLAQSASDYTTVYRYSGFDGLTSQYQYQNQVSGLTAYTLTSTQLKNTFCVIGKKSKILTGMSDFTNNSKMQLTVDTPLVADVAGAFNRVYMNNQFYLTAAGYGPGKQILNADAVLPTIVPTSDDADALKAKRINFYSNSTQGAYLATDFVGLTGISPKNANRIGVNQLAIELKQIITDYINANGFIGRPNNTQTWAYVTSQLSAYLKNSLPTRINNAIDRTIALNHDFDQTYNGTPNVNCSALNNQPSSDTLNISVTVFPIAIQTSPSVGSNIVTVNVSVAIDG